MKNKYYVYAICDPSKIISHDILSHQPIYIGKGSGNRCYSHLREARGEIAISNNLRKIEKIKEIYSRDFEPEIIFIEQNMSEETAYELEKAYIQFFGREDLDINGILSNIFIDKPSLGGGVKGMKHKNKRKYTVGLRTGWKPSAETRALWIQQRTGRIVSEETKKKMGISRTGEKNGNSLIWSITSPEGKVETVCSLKNWCVENKVKYSDVYHSRNGFIATTNQKGKGGRKNVTIR